MADKIKSFSLLTGGGADTLDAFAYAALTSADFAFGLVSGLQHAYKYDTTLIKAATEAPYFIVPVDNGTGTGAWVLQGFQGATTHIEYIHTVGTSITSGLATKVIYDTKIYDTLNEFDGVNSLFIPKNDGFYSIKPQTQFVSGAWAANSELRHFIYKDISSTPVLLKRSRRNQRGAIMGYRGLDWSTSVYAEAGDELEVQVYQSSGSPLALETTSGYNWLIIDRTI